MAIRLHEPGVFATADVGRVYVINYRVLTAVATERAIWADYQRHCDAIGGRTLILTSSDHPPLPMPPVEVRAFWRESLVRGHGVEAFAAISRGFVGLAAAATTNLFEHIVDPGLGVRFRVFAKPAPAVAWLGKIGELGAPDAEIMAQLETLRALP